MDAQHSDLVTRTHQIVGLYRLQIENIEGDLLAMRGQQVMGRGAKPNCFHRTNET
jgi:hypothetical protein